ncbi:MAG: T9SS type A sorting domain-containing protein, partial [Bacteroidota bacterium]
MDLLWQSRSNTKEKKTLFKQYVKNKAKLKTKKQLHGAAELLLAVGEKENRIAILDEIEAKYKDTPLVEHVLFSKFMCYLYEENNIELAKTTAAELGKLFPESESYYASQRHLGNDVERPLEQLAKNAPNEETTEIPKTYELLGNYPNPFNPSTTIRYALPYSSNVELTIYDITGKVVKVFNENGQSA